MREIDYNVIWGLFEQLADLCGRVEPFCTASDSRELEGLLRYFVNTYRRQANTRDWSEDEADIYNICHTLLGGLANIRMPALWLMMIERR